MNYVTLLIEGEFQYFLAEPDGDGEYRLVPDGRVRPDTSRGPKAPRNPETTPCLNCSERSLLKRAASGLKGLTKAELGIDKATPDVEMARRRVCDGCPLNDWGMCVECGCYLHAKVKIASEKCPHKKWPA